MMTRNVLIIVANASDAAMVQRCFALQSGQQRVTVRGQKIPDLLAQTIVIVISLALAKQYLHAFGHIDPQKHIRIT